jgi:hypothetical protein
MATLTEISISTRRFIRYGVYALILILIARFTFNITVLIYKRLNPPPPPPPTVGFGKLSTLSFPVKPLPEGLRYSLETPEGTLPEFPLSLPVYVVMPHTPKIQALEEAQDLSWKLGFAKTGKLKLENVKNVWDFPSTIGPSTLTINIVTGMFSVSYNLQSDPDAIQTFPPSSDEAKAKAIDFFGNVPESAKDIEDSITTTQFFRAEPKGESLALVPAFSQSDAQFTKVNLFRKNFGDEGQYPSVTSKMPEGNMWVLFGGNERKRLIAAEYRYFKIDETVSETYPLITAEVAWNNLKENKGYIASIDEGVKQIIVRKVYLAYYDPDSYTQYFQPVVVFEGDNNFVAYVPAITDEYYGIDETE